MSATPDPAKRSMLLVHAHPDDEAIGTGATMAKYAADGVRVILVTCTLGEEGEVLLDDHEHLLAARSDRLGEHRRDELATAMRELGVADWRLLGKPGKYRDSGMMGETANDAPGCFWRADLLEAAADLVHVIREARPQVLVTYDERGGYGHPDHVQAHRVAMYGAQLASVPTFRLDLGRAWDVPKIYWTAFPKSVLRRGIAALRAAGDTSAISQIDVDSLPFGVTDDVLTTAIDGSAFVDRKVAAMRRYPTQIDMDSGLFSLWRADPVAFGIEYFRLVKGEVGLPPGSGMERDLFAGT